MLWRCPSLRGPQRITEEEWRSDLESPALLHQLRAVQRAHDAAVRLGLPIPTWERPPRCRPERRRCSSGPPIKFIVCLSDLGLSPNVLGHHNPTCTPLQWVKKKKNNAHIALQYRQMSLDYYENKRNPALLFLKDQH